MKRKDGSGCEDLTLVVYDALCTTDEGFFKTETDIIAWLKQQGFTVVETRVVESVDEIIRWHNEVDRIRDDKLPFGIDGLVVKLPEVDLADLRRDRPERQIAYKFPLEERESTLREVVWSESGATYTPVGVFDAVRFKDATVKQASLNNPQQIKDLGLRIGSRVVVVKRGEIIPKIISLAPTQPPESETSSVAQPETCSACGTTLVTSVVSVKRAGNSELRETRLFCPNPACPKRLLHRLKKWITVVNIMEIGDKLIEALFKDGLVHQIHDLYCLDAAALTPYFLEEKSRAKNKVSKGAEKAARSIKKPRELTLAAFVAGFDFEGVAENILRLVTDAGFDTLDKLRAASVADLTSVYGKDADGKSKLAAGVAGIGEITAKTIVDGLRETAVEMDAVLATGCVTLAPPAPKLPLTGLSFCFTGELRSMKRAVAAAKVLEAGGQVKTSVVKGLSYLVTNDAASGSTKNKKAAEYGVKVIDEAAFLALFQTAGALPQQAACRVGAQVQPE
jgi:DNA ligase (NAD+)